MVKFCIRLRCHYRLGPIRFPLFWIKARYTRHGPLIQEDNKKHRGYSLGWYAMSDLPVHLKSLAPETAVSAADAARQFRDLPTPTLNVVAADMEGRLAYRTCGWVPGYRSSPDPLPLDGTSKTSDFPALIPADSMPGSDSPADGYFVNTNNRPAGASYPFQIGDFFMSYRAQRLWWGRHRFEVFAAGMMVMWCAGARISLRAHRRASRAPSQTAA